MSSNRKELFHGVIENDLRRVDPKSSRRMTGNQTWSPRPDTDEMSDSFDDEPTTEEIDEVLRGLRYY